MNKYYDNFLKTTLTTNIKEYRDGYYIFDETIFYGEKGGALSDEGTINNLKVTELKWEDETLLHKVDGELQNPITMKVNLKTRYINTALQSAFHILDGYYAKLGLYIPAIGAHPENMWYEVNSKDITDKDLDKVQDFMNKVIQDDVPVTFTYINGKDYPDEKYHQFEELRIVEFKDLDKQPCGTLHLNKTSQIQSFIILDHEKTSRGTRVHVALNLTSNDRLKEYHNILKKLSQTLNVPKNAIEENIEHLLLTNKTLKKEIDALKKQLIEYKLEEYLNNPNTIIEADFTDQNQLRALSQALIGKVNTTKYIVTTINNEVNFAIISHNDTAREILDKIKEKTQVMGGGSPKMVCAKVTINQLDFINIIKDI